jgi:glycosyltransferase involved in cell wall biosynthesis
VSGIVFAIPGDLDLPTGGYGYDRRLLAQWRESGIAARHLALPGSFPFPTADDLATTERLLAETAADEVLLIDGLAFGAFPETLAARFSQRLVALVHHPLALETGRFPGEVAFLRRSERLALGHARAVVVTGSATRDTLAADYAVSGAIITVAVPGTDPAMRATRASIGAPVRLLAVGSIIPRKGYDILVEALAAIRDRRWIMTIAGSPDHAPRTVDFLHDKIAMAGLADRIRLAGAVHSGQLMQLYDNTDVFVMSSLFEGYGMVLTEALARGLPIVCTRSGPGAEALPDAAACKVPTGDANALAKGLADLIDDAGVRRRMADAAWAAADSLPRWNDTAARVAQACLKVM